MAGDSRIGTEFAGYHIESLLGRGGMAVVFLAHDPRLGRRVALKVLAGELSEDDRFRDRFIRESQAAASLDHPNIIPIYEAGAFEDTLFIAMRYVDGTDLKQLLTAEGPMPVARAVAVLSQIAGALDAAHAQGLVHRDVKPANILIAKRQSADAPDHVYLSDFGLAKNSSSNTGLTQTGQFVGTLDYIAPEQIEGKKVDGRTDIYSLGGVLYQCIVGKPPFDKDSGPSMMYAHLQEAPPKVSTQRPRVPAAMDDVIAKAMAKSPDDRYQTAGDMISAARRAMVAPSGGVASDATQVSATPVAVTPPPVVTPALAAAAVADSPSVADLPIPRPVSGRAKWKDAPILIDTNGGAARPAARKPGQPEPKRRGMLIIAGMLLAVLCAAGLTYALVHSPTSVNPTPTPGATATPGQTAQPSGSGKPTPVPTPGPVDIATLSSKGLPLRDAFAIGYDPVTGRLIMVGGYSFDPADPGTSTTTFSWDGHTWEALGTASPEVFSPTLVNDPATGHLLLVGGKPLGAMWMFDGHSWSQIPKSQPPVDLDRGNVGVFGAKGQVLLNGDDGTLLQASQQQGQQQGQGQGSAHVNGSYVWNGTAWAKATGPVGWLYNSQAGIAYDPKSGRTIQFGGVVKDKDTLAWNGTRWSAIKPTNTPPAGAASACLDGYRNEIIMVAGAANIATLPTTWTWDGSNWQRQVVAEPPLKGDKRLVYDPSIRAVVLVNVDVVKSEVTMWVRDETAIDGDWIQIK